MAASKSKADSESSDNKNEVTDKQDGDTKPKQDDNTFVKPTQPAPKSASALTKNEGKENEKDEATANEPKEKEKEKESIDWSTCKLCFFRFKCLEDYQLHCSGMVHQQRVTKKAKVTAISKMRQLASAQNKEKMSNKDEKVLQNEQKKTAAKQTIEKDKPFVKKSVQNSDTQELYCDKCKITCTGTANFEMHLQGQRHLKNAAAQRMGGGDNFMDQSPNRKRKRRRSRIAVMDSKLMEIKTPVIGLRFIVEIQKEDAKMEPRYICELCDSKADPRTIITHLTGLKHRQKHVRLNYPEKIADNTKAGKKLTGAQLYEALAQEIEALEGRKPVRVKVEPNDDGPLSNRPSGPNSYGGIKRPGGGPFGFPGKKPRNDFQEFRGSGFRDNRSPVRGFSGGWRGREDSFDRFDSGNYSPPNRPNIPSLFDRPSYLRPNDDFPIRDDFRFGSSWRDDFDRERNLSPPRQGFSFHEPSDYRSFGSRDSFSRDNFRDDFNRDSYNRDSCNRDSYNRDVFDRESMATRELFERPTPLMPTPPMHGGGFGHRGSGPLMSTPNADTGRVFPDLPGLGKVEAMQVSNALQALLQLQRNMN